MTEGALREFDRLANSIRSGGFLDILSSVIGFGLQLGGSGLFGKSIQQNILSVPGRAFGGPVMANQPYIVGERRAEPVGRESCRGRGGQYVYISVVAVSLEKQN